MPNSTSRRDFLRASLLTTAVFGSERSLSAQETRQSSDNSGKARNVIFMVADGMNHATLSLAKQYRTLTAQKETNWLKLYRELPVARSLMETFSANSCVTDSAAAASTWGGGQRVNNGALNVVPETGAPIRTILEKAQASGRKTGLVTTTTITHATPAGFAVNVNSRGKESDIAAQYFDRKVDVLLGGGQNFFSAELRQKFAGAGYDFAETRDQLHMFEPERSNGLLGLFAEDHLPYTIDRDHLPELAAKVPMLAEMTNVALNRLSKSPNGFFLMVEGGRVDHACHNNDAAAAIHDQLAFDDAVGSALAFIDQQPDTLLILTTDHGCGGMHMNGINGPVRPGAPVSSYTGSDAAFAKLRGFNRSLDWMKDNALGNLEGPALAEALRLHTGLDLTEDDIKSAHKLKLSITQVFQRHTGVGFTSGNHTGELVEFCAYGPGSQLFLPFLQNWEVHNHLLKAMDMGA